jgi:hypothetical protein
VTGPAHGTLGAVNQGIGTVTYTPAHGFIGTDQFTFMASDGTNASTPVTETVTVQPPPRPTISRLRQSARKWRRGHKPAKISRKRTPPIGTTFSFVLNETATVKFTFLVPEPGRKVGRKCVARNAHNVQRRACTRLVVTGSLRFTGHAGTDRVYFDGLLPHHKRLALGSYVLEIVATNAIGQKSATKTVKFTIVA